MIAASGGVVPDDIRELLLQMLDLELARADVRVLRVSGPQLLGLAHVFGNVVQEAVGFAPAGTRVRDTATVRPRQGQG